MKEPAWRRLLIVTAAIAAFAFALSVTVHRVRPAAGMTIINKSYRLDRIERLPRYPLSFPGTSKLVALPGHVRLA